MPLGALNQFLWDVGEESRGTILGRASLVRTAECMEQVQLTHRPRHADVAEPPFLLQLSRIVLRERMGQELFLHADHEDDGKLETLGLVQGNQRDCVWRAVGEIVDVGDEGDVFEERVQCSARLDCRVVLRDGQQFLDVLPAALRLRFAVGLPEQPLAVSDLDEDRPEHFGKRF